MPESILTTLEGKTNVFIGGLRLALAAATAPRVPIGAYKAAEDLRPSLLPNIRQLVRIDLSAVQEPWSLKAVLTYSREIAGILDRLVQVEDLRQCKRIRYLVGTREAIESVLKTLEDKIEDLEIATSPEVRAALEQLIDEAKAP